MTLVYVPAGEFTMGSTTEDPGADPDEFPQHTIYLDAYWIGKTEVTNAMYAVFLNEMGNQIEERAAWLTNIAPDVLIFQNQEGSWQPKSGYEQHPVVEVTWYGAQAYCTWSGGQLPTEAEWEKAARGTAGGVFPWNGGIDCSKAEYNDCRNAQLQPVGGRPAGASPFNALDMTGNAWEWVADWYSRDYYASSPAENPLGPESGTARVVRGGSYGFDAKHARPANRRSDGPLVSKPDYGFRCVIPIEP